MDMSMIERIERGQRNVSIWTPLRMTDTLDIDPGVVLYGLALEVDKQPRKPRKPRPAVWRGPAAAWCGLLRAACWTHQ